MTEKCHEINMDNRCRICLNDGNSMMDIFIPEILMKIKEFTASISIIIDDNDNLPKNICHICLYKLDMCHEFKQQLLNSNKLLKNLLKRRDLSNAEKNTVVINSNDGEDLISDRDLTQLGNALPQIDCHPLEASTSAVTNNENLETETQSVFASTVMKNKVGNSSEGQQTKLSPMKTRQLGVRRTNEQRMASTQRWVARKRALLAATGENDSDTDSINSDATLKLLPLKRPRKSLHYIDNENNQFKSQSVQSELVMGDAIFVVTSTLCLSESPYFNQFSNNMKLSLSRKNNIVTHEQQNMDIINALQLRRINSSNKDLMYDRKFLERCLNIEVEGTELETLQRIQFELASFVESDIKKKLIDEDDLCEKTDKTDIKPQDSLQSLEEQLKMIVEKAIKKNLNRSQGIKCTKMNQTTEFHSNKTFSAAFIKAAMNSQIFQPKVVLNRLDLKFISFVENNKNMYKLTKQPLTDFSCFENQVSNNKSNNRNYESNAEILKTHNRSMKKLQRHNSEVTNLRNDNLLEKRHICGACGMSFNSKLQVEEHFIVHKKKQMLLQKSKKKMMRCKKCHQIVEADFVKTHICESLLSKHYFKCHKCNTIFRTKDLLLEHQKVYQTNSKVMNVSNVALKSPYSCFICDKKFTNDDLLKEHLQNHCNDVNEEHNTIGNDEKLYQCAICGHALDTEEKLENHVEQHLFDDADDNPSLITIVQTSNKKNSSKIQPDVIHSCFQCGEKFDTNVKLALHMQVHEEEEAIIKWQQDGFQTQNNYYTCTICDNPFYNKQELDDHLNLHNNASCTCILCDRPFLTLAELQSHVDTH
ncbi:zinc finger protein 879-like [Microplitis mediator]|uniref:zinc finger protein 879-like n=1 Tax=Microplitis mediator TaxID=375433 RepID=UPI002554872B|nr:zinc finger protein 879-like [Microplitis mediator]XP_057335931.1 zinc finger protein 879-like [Microplitis mediator]XP_057335932.1 zinc finger protein 879-like [Microplitis mediator]